jgi:hypothetical protein
MAEQVKYRKRTDMMLRAALEKHKAGIDAKIFSEQVSYDGTKKRYHYPFEEMRPLIDTIVIPVSNDPKHDYGRLKVKYRVRTHSFRRNRKVSIAYDGDKSAIIVTLIN